MTFTHRLCLFLGLTLLIAGAGAKGARVAPSAATPPPNFLRPCRAPGSEAGALCGTYEVFENRASRRGRRIALNIVVLPALSEKPAPDAVFFFAGGPGQGAASLAAVIAEPMARIRRERDLVLLDQRGTGKSNPLSCNLYGDGDELRDYYGEMFPVAKVRECREHLERVADLRQYTTSVAVEDLDEVRRALGYERINLYGGSYGTTVALAYLRRYGRHVRSVVLAGAAPPGFKLPLPFARGGEHAMKRVMEDCAADAACRSEFPNLREELAAVLNRLDRGPVSLGLINPSNKQSQRFSMGRGVFAERLRMLLFDPGSASLVPLLVHRAYLGDYAPFVRAALPQARGIYRSLSIGMYFSVTCSENVPLISEQEIGRETAGTFLGDYRTRVHINACREWPRGVVTQDFTRAVNSDAPVLILSNEADPAAPYWFGADAARHLPNGRQVIIRQVGHNYSSPCISSVAAEFISKGSAEGLNTSCLDNVARPPFATQLPAELSRRVRAADELKQVSDLSR